MANRRCTLSTVYIILTGERRIQALVAGETRNSLNACFNLI